MTLLRTSENKDANFNLYFLGYPGDKGIPTASANGVSPVADREGLLELTWNYGTEKDANFQYHNGNDQPQGFGHICTVYFPRIMHRILTSTGVSVDDLDAACKRFDDLGVNWKKRLTDGRMKNVAFVLDPDNYWIEIIQNEKLKGRANW
jgi:lactoylglutathione lyase